MILQSVLFSVKSSDNKDLKELLLSLFFNIFYFSEREVIKNDNNSLTLRRGHALEETVAEEFSRQTGLRVYEVKEM